MDPKIELYTAICSAMDKPDAKIAIWDIITHYNIIPTAACSDLEESVREFLAAKRADSVSERTIKNYTLILNAFSKWINGVPPVQIITDNIRCWLSYLKVEKNMAKGSVQTYLNCLRSFFSWLHAEEKIPRNPLNRIRSAHIDKKNTRQPLTQEEVERCRAVLHTPREQAIFEMYLSTGCRVSELVNLPVNQIDFQNRTVTVTGKGDKSRTVYFSVRAKLAIQSYLETSKNKEILFTSASAPYESLGIHSIQNIIHKIGENAGLSCKLHPHKLRHTFATQALNAGMDIVMIQQLLGHSNLDTTQIYAQLSQEAVRHSYNQLVS